MTDKTFPVQVGSATNWLSAAAGVGHTVAIKTDGTIWAWGDNGSGQLGDGTTTSRMLPQKLGSPTILSQPMDVISPIGSVVTFSVTIGGSQPLSCQWWRAGTNLLNDARISGVTGNSLTISNVQAFDESGYSVVVSNAYGSVTSAIAVLNVSLATIANAVDATNLVWTTGGNVPWFFQTATNHDGVDSAQSGAITSNEVSWVETTVAGPGTLSFWWQASLDAGDRFEFSYGNDSDYWQEAYCQGCHVFAPWAKETYSIQAGTQTLRWVWTNYVGQASGLGAVWLDQVQWSPVPSAPTITMQPTGRSVGVGDGLTFAVAATGTIPLSYQWRKDGANLIDGGRHSGVASANLTISNVQTNDAGNFNVVVTNAYGSVTSSVAVLTVRLEPTIAAQPQSQLVLSGANALLAVSAHGAAPLTFQWFKDGIPLADSGHIAGAHTSTLVITNTAVSDSGLYSVVVSNTFGVTNSSLATLVVRQQQQCVVTGNLNAGGAVTKKVMVSGNRAYLGNGHNDSLTVLGNLDIVDVSNPSGPSRMGGTVVGYSDINSVAIVGDLAYLAVGFSIPMGLAIVNVSNPVAPAVLGTYDMSGAVQHGNDVVISGSTAYLAAGGTGTLHVFDVSNPTNIARWGGWTNSYTAGNLDLSGNLAYVAASGLHVIDVSNPGSPVRIGGTSPGYIGSVAVSGSLAYTVGSQDLRVYDVANPSNVVWRASVSLSNASDLTLCGNTAYVACGSNGVTMVDVSIPTAPAIVGTVATPGEARSLAVVGNLAYVADGLAGLTIISLGTNSAPSILNPPQGQSVPAGGSALFSIGANGTSPLRYQWLFANAPLAGATNSLLWLANVGASQAGGYSVIIANDYGSVTSSVATLAVQLPQPPTPTLLTADGGFGVSAGQFGFNLAGPSGLVVIIEASTNLVNWLPIQTNALINGQVRFTDPQSRAFSKRFYRARFAFASSPQLILQPNAGNARFVSNCFGFNLRGMAGQTVVIEASADLVAWTPLLTNSLLTGYYYFNDPASSNFNRRFYRGRLLP
jgi:hypothetical protein